MVCRYTSKTSAEIKIIIGNLEDSITSAESSGDQKIDYNGIEYEINDYVKQVSSQIEIWLEKLCWAEESEGVSNTPKRFTRFEGYC